MPSSDPAWESKQATTNPEFRTDGLVVVHCGIRFNLLFQFRLMWYFWYIRSSSIKGNRNFIIQIRSQPNRNRNFKMWFWFWLTDTGIPSTAVYSGYGRSIAVVLLGWLIEEALTPMLWKSHPQTWTFRPLRLPQYSFQWDILHKFTNRVSIANMRQPQFYFTKPPFNEISHLLWGTVQIW